MRRNQLFEAFTEKQKHDLEHWVEMQQADPLNKIPDAAWAAYFGCGPKHGSDCYRIISSPNRMKEHAENEENFLRLNLFT